MEVRRKTKGTDVKSDSWRKIREWTNVYGLYRLSSNYGASYVQAFMVLVMLILFISLMFLYAGFRVTEPGMSKPGPIVEYNLLSDSQHHPATVVQWITDYGSAVSLSLSIITFQKDRLYEPLEGWSRFGLYVAVVVLTAQGALVLLAIRRRFRR